MPRVPIAPTPAPQPARDVYEQIMDELKALHPEAIAARAARVWKRGRSIGRVPIQPQETK